MPMVGGKEFPYTKKGMTDAKKASKMTGKSMMDAKKSALKNYGKKK